MARIEDSTGRETLLQVSGLTSGRVLDVGMGGCACMAFFLARKGFEVTGVDRSSHAVHRARVDAARKRLKGTFVARRADAVALPFENGSFDAVLSFHSLHHMEHPVAAIHEMFRVCRPGGLVLLADLHETGRKIYKHEPDREGLLATVESEVSRRSASVAIRDTRLDRLFVCKTKTKTRDATRMKAASPAGRRAP